MYPLDTVLLPTDGGCYGVGRYLVAQYLKFGINPQELPHALCTRGGSCVSPSPFNLVADVGKTLPRRLVCHRGYRAATELSKAQAAPLCLSQVNGRSARDSMNGDHDSQPE